MLLATEREEVCRGYKFVFQYVLDSHHSKRNGDTKLIVTMFGYELCVCVYLVWMWLQR